MADGDQPQGEVSAPDGPTLDAILHGGDAPQRLRSLHEIASGIALAAAAKAPPGATSGLFDLVLSDSEGFVRAVVVENTGLQLGPHPAWLRFLKPSADAGVLFVISNPSPAGAVEFMVFAHPGMLNRSIIRAAVRWAFFAVGASRLVAHLPIARDDLADYARRGGFHHEGTARGYFHGEGDAAVWAMTRKSCRWLPHDPPAIPVSDTSPPSSLGLH